MTWLQTRSGRAVILDSGIDATKDLYDEDSYVVAESAEIALDNALPVAGHPYTEGVLFDDGAVGTLQPTAEPYVWDWRGDRWACCGPCSVVHDGPRIDTDRPWVTRPNDADLTRISALIDRADQTLGRWEPAYGRWEGCGGLTLECARAGDREVVVDQRYIRGGRHLRWTCSLVRGEPVCGWDGDRLVIAVMPMRSNRIVVVGST